MDAAKTKLKYYFCEIEGMRKTQKVVAAVTGILVIISSILGIVTQSFNLLRVLKHLWYSLFGLIMCAIEYNRFNELLRARLGFIQTQFGRGMFYLFVGSL